MEIDRLRADVGSEVEVVDTEAQEREGVEVPAEAPAQGQRLVEADVVVGARSDALVVELEIVALG